MSSQVARWDEFTGRVAAVETVQMRPRVGGYIDQVNFAEGQEVQKGEVLFTIDPRSYKAELDRAEADLTRARSRAALARSEAERAPETGRGEGLLDRDVRPARRRGHAGAVPISAPPRRRWRLPGSTSSTPRCARPSAAAPAARS